MARLVAVARLARPARGEVGWLSVCLPLEGMLMACLNCGSLRPEAVRTCSARSAANTKRHSCQLHDARKSTPFSFNIGPLTFLPVLLIQSTILCENCIEPSGKRQQQ